MPFLPAFDTYRAFSKKVHCKTKLYMGSHAHISDAIVTLREYHKIRVSAMICTTLKHKE